MLVHFVVFHNFVHAPLTASVPQAIPKHDAIYYPRRDERRGNDISHMGLLGILLNLNIHAH
jgi:hypothetical protein